MSEIQYSQFSNCFRCVCAQPQKVPISCHLHRSACTIAATPVQISTTFNVNEFYESVMKMQISL